MMEKKKSNKAEIDASAKSCSQIVYLLTKGAAIKSWVWTTGLILHFFLSQLASILSSCAGKQSNMSWLCLELIWWRSHQVILFFFFWLTLFNGTVQFNHVSMVSSISSLESCWLAIFFKERRWHSDKRSLLAESRMAVIIWNAKRNKRYMSVFLRQWFPSITHHTVRQ